MVDTSTVSNAWLLTTLRSALSLLSASSEVQLKYLDDLGLPDVVDELALEFDDVAPAVGNLVEVRAITTNAADAVRRVDAQLAAMSGEQRSQLWTPQALRTAPEWDEVRRLADRALALLPATDQPRTPD